VSGLSGQAAGTPSSSDAGQVVGLHAAIRCAPPVS
jgi:hypothetical protein